MRDESKPNAHDASAASFIEHEIERATNNMRCAMNKFGHAAVRAANPVPWFRRYPLKCSLITGVALAGGAVAFVMAIRKKKSTDSNLSDRPIHVYVKKPKAKSRGLGAQLVGALIGGLSAKLADTARAAIAQTISPESFVGCRPHTVIVPNPNLRDVQI